MIVNRVVGQLHWSYNIYATVICIADTRSVVCIAGNVHCLGCGKAFKEHSVLAQHLKDRHQGRNTADASNARGNLTLGDIMAQAQAKRAAVPSQAAAAAERHQKQYSAFTPGDSRGMREYLKVCVGACACVRVCVCLRLRAHLCLHFWAMPMTPPARWSPIPFEGLNSEA